MTSKANDYFAALADFRRNDEDDVFVPMNPDLSFREPIFSMPPMLSAHSKVVGSRVAGVYGAAAVSSVGMLNYASVAKTNPQYNLVSGERRNFVTRVSSNFPRLDRNNNEFSRDGLPVNMSKPPPPSSIASSAAGRLRTLNGARIVNGINLANLKFVKPAPQCFKWDDQSHRQEQPNCRLWHPRELCKYYPKCTLTAEVCGFGHPFCGEYCECDPKKRSLQENHRVVPLHVQEAKEYMKQNSMIRGKTPR